MSGNKSIFPITPLLFSRDALFLAPMVALSHRALRELILEFGGLDFAYTEMASAGAAVSGSPYENCYLDSGPDPSKVVYQLFTAKSERLSEALAMLKDKQEQTGRFSERTSISVVQLPT